ncbi:MAG: hypothetical protein PW786_02895 [Arachidicoccus sp.]|nr:hypothetical protein [Arachidicoccus sp.]
MHNKILITAILLLSATIGKAQKSLINDFINVYNANGKADVRAFSGSTLSNEIVTGVPDSAKAKYPEFLSQIINALQKLDSVHIMDNFKDTGMARQTIFQGLKSQLIADNYTEMLNLKLADKGKITLLEKEGNKDSINDFVLFIGKGTIAHAHGIISKEDIENIVAATKKEISITNN